MTSPKSELRKEIFALHTRCYKAALRALSQAGPAPSPHALSVIRCLNLKLKYSSHALVESLLPDLEPETLEAILLALKHTIEGDC